MEEEIDYERLKAEVRKIRYNLFEVKTPMRMGKRLKYLNIMRYNLGLIEDKERVKKVEYDCEEKKLRYSESIEIGIAIALAINEEIRATEGEEQVELWNVMKETYYYLARYLFEYFLVAMEFGIPAEKQFIAPRTSVLNRVAREMSKFYYREDRPIMTLSMPQGTGKEQPLSSKILTPSGWIRMGDVRVGTRVIGADGKACNVVGVYPKGIKDVYRVEFNDGTYVDCGLEHLWEVQTRSDRGKKTKKTRIVDTEQMLKDFKIVDKYHTYNNYSVRLVKPVEFCYKEKIKEDDIKPYILGTLIANGCFTGLTLTFTTGEYEVVENVKKVLPEYLEIQPLKKEYAYMIKKTEQRRDKLGHFTPNEYLAKIKEYELYGKKAATKFIPKKYLYASIEERIELLRGLMDGDGYISKEGWCIYTTVSEQLKDDVLELVRSLGARASFSKKKAGYKNKEGIWIRCKDVYQINFQIDIMPVGIQHKAERYKKPSYNFQKMITNITKVRQEECQCIMVDHPEHLYVTDGYTLTHNTEISKRFMSWAIGKDSHLPNMMISYSASLAKDKFFNRNRCPYKR